MGPASLRYLLDSVIVIDHFNGIELATTFLQEQGSECALSVIARSEILAGFDEESAPLARELLDLFPTLPLTVETADLAAQVRRKQHLKLPDALQAAIAILNNLVLVTRNTRDFQPGAVAEVLIPYRL